MFLPSQKHQHPTAHFRKRTEMPTLPSNVPVAPPPPGVHSFLVNPPDTLIRTYSIVCFLLLGISFLTVGLRLYTRAIVLRGVGPDDCMCLSLSHSIVLSSFLPSFGAPLLEPAQRRETRRNARLTISHTDALLAALVSFNRFISRGRM